MSARIAVLGALLIVATPLLTSCVLARPARAVVGPAPACRAANAIPRDARTPSGGHWHGPRAAIARPRFA